MASNTLQLHPTVFCSDAFLSLHTPPVLSLKQPGPIPGLLHFFSGEDESALYLQNRAPFIQGYLSHCPVSAFGEMLHEACKLLDKKHIYFHCPVEIVSVASGFYNLATDGKYSFREHEASVNYHLNISDIPFYQTLPSDQRRVLLRQKSLGLDANYVGVDQLRPVYEVIARNRASKAYPLTISYESMRESFEKLPFAYRAYAAYGTSGDIMGGAVVVAVTDKLWYTYLLGHLPIVGQSPTLALLDAIYTDCQQHDVQILDLGTAGRGTHMLGGLAAFKRSVGGIQMFKRTIVYTLYT